jgi:hypothetical protein
MGWGSGIRKKHIPDPGVKKHRDPGSGSATLPTANSYSTHNHILKSMPNFNRRQANNDIIWGEGCPVLMNKMGIIWSRYPNSLSEEPQC